MSKYELVSGIIFEDGTLVPAGKIVELDEKAESTQGYLNRGSIKPYVEGEVNAEQPQQSTETSAEATTQLTAEQLAKDFQQAGVEGSPDVPQPN